MQYISSERDGSVAVVTMARGKANALNEPMVDELNQAIADAASDGSVRAVVLAGSGARFFSGGFDVAEVFAYDRHRMTEFFGRFIDLYEATYHMSKPVVAAVTGHAYAGGAILAVACDFRVMAEGEFGFAVNEINLGFMLPSGMIRMVIDAVGFRQGFEMLLTGRSISPATALQIGLAVEIAKSESVVERALDHARTLAEKPPSAFAGVKRSLRSISAGASTGISDRETLADFIDQWFSPEAEERKGALIKSLER